MGFHLCQMVTSGWIHTGYPGGYIQARFANSICLRIITYWSWTGCRSSLYSAIDTISCTRKVISGGAVQNLLSLQIIWYLNEDTKCLAPCDPPVTLEASGWCSIELISMKQQSPKTNHHGVWSFSKQKSNIFCHSTEYSILRRIDLAQRLLSVLLQ